MTLEGFCPKCGRKWYGWGLLKDPRCSECGILLEISRGGERFSNSNRTEAGKDGQSHHRLM